MTIKCVEDTASSAGKARVVVSAREGIIEIEGSEHFVSDQLTRLKAVITQVVTAGAKWRAQGDQRTWLRHGKAGCNGRARIAALPRSRGAVPSWS